MPSSLPHPGSIRDWGHWGPQERVFRYLTGGSSGTQDPELDRSDAGKRDTALVLLPGQDTQRLAAGRPSAEQQLTSSLSTMCDI